MTADWEKMTQLEELSVAARWSVPSFPLHFDGHHGTASDPSATTGAIGEKSWKWINNFFYIGNEKKFAGPRIVGP